MKTQKNINLKQRIKKIQIFLKTLLKYKYKQGLISIQNRNFEHKKKNIPSKKIIDFTNPNRHK